MQPSTFLRLSPEYRADLFQAMTTWIVQHCYTWLRADSSSTMSFSIVTPGCGLFQAQQCRTILLTTVSNAGSTTLLHPVFINLEQVIIFGRRSCTILFQILKLNFIQTFMHMDFMYTPFNLQGQIFLLQRHKACTRTRYFNACQRDHTIR